MSSLLIRMATGPEDDGLDDLETGIATRTRPKTKKPSNYKVLMLNDDYTPMEFVVLVLQRFFSMGIEDATRVMPATIATVVITIGWARLCPASQIASFLGIPWFIISTAKSTSRIEFLATMPNSIRMPMRTKSEIG